MTDDAHNVWGTRLFLLSKHDRNMFKAQSSVFLEDELKRIIANTFSNKYHLQKVCADGSTANIFAIIDATKGDSGNCLIAAGSYLTAAGCVLCNLATTVFQISSALSVIRSPDDDDELSARRAIIALPYYIPGCITEDQLNVYEDMCFTKLHEKLLLYRVMGRPIMALFLELMLAGNGASLSDRALSKIAILSRKHDFKIIVDEIMTGGRTGTILLLTTKPIEFVNCVSHVTLGKWCKCGIILVSTEQHIIEQRQQDNVTAPCSNSTSIDLHQVIPLWNKLVTVVLMADLRREAVLKKIKCKERDSWGKGVLIFTPVKNNTTQGLGHRLLPMLEQTQISCNASSPYAKGSTTFRDQMNNSIMDAINEWNEIQIYNDLTMPSVLEHLRVIRYLIIRANDINVDNKIMVSTEETHEAIDRSIKYTKLATILNYYNKAGLLEYKLVGKKRLRNWIILDTFEFKLYVTESI